MTTSTQAHLAAPISSIRISDSKLVNKITEFIRDAESPLLFNHSSRVYCFAAFAGQGRGLEFDTELLYAGDVTTASLLENWIDQAQRRV